MGRNPHLIRHAPHPVNDGRRGHSRPVSILDNAAPHTVVVYSEESVADSLGNPVKRPSANGVTITGVIAPVSTKRDKDGQEIRADVQLLAISTNWSLVKSDVQRSQLLAISDSARNRAGSACSPITG